MNLRESHADVFGGLADPDLRTVMEFITLSSRASMSGAEAFDTICTSLALTYRAKMVAS